MSQRELLESKHVDTVLIIESTTVELRYGNNMHANGRSGPFEKETDTQRSVDQNFRKRVCKQTKLRER